MDVVVVTGGGSGIGLHTVLAFARRGDRVHAIVRDRRRCDRLRAALDAEPLPVSIVELDVTDGPGVAAMVAEVIAAEGRIDVVVNNAGIAEGVSAVEEIDESLARAVWETNWWAPFRLIRAVLPHMRSAGRGVIVNLSTFGTRFPGGPGLAMYGCSKQAVTRLTESVQAEVEGTGVRVVSIEPGFFATDIYRDDRRPTIDEASFYAPMVRRVDGAIAAGISSGADPAIVAASIVAAASDATAPTRMLVGDDAADAYRRFRGEQMAQWQAEIDAEHAAT
jgi:NAD(P)-dependent dehydrogenase (short-subunit alcohol dehydrogenase family)